MARAKSSSILPGTKATAELLSFIIFSKFFQGLPLYRLEELFGLQGVDLSRSRMASWLINISKKLVPIYNVLNDWSESTGYMQIDQTRVQVLREKGRKAEAKSAMWVRGSPELNIVLFHYHPSEAGYVAKELLGDFNQTLQSDAHGAFDQVNVGLQLGCMMHSRRRFFEASKATKKGQGLAGEALQWIKKLYAFESLYKEQQLCPEDRRVARVNDCKPILEELKSWCEDTSLKVPPSSAIGDAIHYYINHYTRLTNYLEDGRYEADNGFIERVIKKFAVGRRNWLFCTSVDGAEASSVLYSLAITAKLNNKDPYEVLLKILTELPQAKKLEDYEKLARLLVTRTKV